MLKVAIYCRLSEEDKDKFDTQSESESIQNQKNILTSYAHEQGWQLYKIYSDDDWSGMDNERPEWNQMLKDAEARKFDIVLCKSQSRFTRDMELVEKYLHHLFLLWNIRFIGIADFADTENRGNKKQRQINGLVNEWYCEDVSENIKVVFDKKRKDGVYIGNYATYGLKKDPYNKGKLLIDEPAAEVVRYIFQLYVDGFGTSSIAKTLNEKKIPNPTLYKKNAGTTFVNASQKDERYLWNRTTIRRFLKNEMYIGNMVQGVHKKISYKSKKQVVVPREQWIVVENTHEAIIDRDTFKLVQKMMRSRTKTDGTGTPYSLAGKIRCLDCGSTMYRIGKKSGSNYFRYLKCSLVDKQSDLCTSHRIRLDHLEELVCQRLRNYLQKANQTILQQRVQAEPPQRRAKNWTDKIRRLDQEITEKNSVIQNLYSDKVKGIITEEQFISFNEAFQSEICDLRKRKEAAEKIAAEEKLRFSEEDIFLQKIQEYQSVTQLTQRIVNEFVDYIEVGEKDKERGTQEIRIHWNY